MAGELALNRANTRPGGLASVKIKDDTGTCLGYYSFLTPLDDVDMTFEDHSAVDGYKRDRSHSHRFNAKVNVPVLKTQANMLSLLATIPGVLLNAKFTSIGGESVATNPTGISQAGIGLKWILHIPFNAEKTIWLELQFQRNATKEDRDLMLTAASAPADGTQTAGDSLYTMHDANMVESDIATGGIQKAELQATTGGWSGPDVLGLLQDGEITMELITGVNGDGMFYHLNRIGVKAFVEAAQFSQAELLRHAVIAKRGNDLRITTVCGWVLKLGNATGIKNTLKFGKDSEGQNVVRVECNGSIALSDWTAGIWSTVGE